MPGLSDPSGLKGIGGEAVDDFYEHMVTNKRLNEPGGFP